MDKEFLEALSQMLDTKLDEKLAPIKEDIATLKSDVNTLKSDVGSLKSDVNILKSDVGSLKSDVSHIKQKIDAVYEQTADLTEFRTDVVIKLDSIENNITTVETVTASNYLYISNLKKSKKI